MSVNGGFLNEKIPRLLHRRFCYCILEDTPRKNGEGTVSFITGWMVKPNGHIHLNTPYGGK